MFRFTKILFGLLLLLGGLQHAAAFSIIGPFDTWQVPALSYALPGDLGGPQNLGEEFRYNTPVLTYAYDPSFLDYFGSHGVVVIDQAMKILNDLPPASAMTPDLNEFPLRTERVNYRAQALNLFDLKSWAMAAMMEQIGLAEAERYVWTLRIRVVPPIIGIPQCTFWYNVIKRNFDPATWEPTAYINGNLYSYQIVDFCPAVDQGVAAPFNVDPQATLFTTVASFTRFEFGGFFTGLTRDDVGGLRYLYRRNNLNNEPLTTGAVLLGGGSSIGGVVGPATGNPWDPIPGTNFFNTNAVTIVPVGGTGVTNTLALRPGVDKLTFVRTDFDSLLGFFILPVTNLYNAPFVVNSSLRSQLALRILTQPDIIFAAADITGVPIVGAVLNAAPIGGAVIARSLAFQTNGTASNNPILILNGPGTIEPPTVIIFNKAGPSNFNTDNNFFDEQHATPNFTWGSFDGTTNPPIVYPSGRSIADLERAALGRGPVP